VRRLEELRNAAQPRARPPRRRQPWRSDTGDKSGRRGRGAHRRLQALRRQGGGAAISPPASCAAIASASSAPTAAARPRCSSSSSASSSPTVRHGGAAPGWRSPTSTSCARCPARPRAPLREHARARTSSSRSTARSRHVIGYLEDFLFPPERARHRCACSPAASATACCWPGCSPALQPAGARRAHQRPRHRHPGAAGGPAGRVRPAPCLLVSHDRAFLDNVTEYVGGYRRGASGRRGRRAPPPPAAKPARKLSFKQKHELEHASSSWSRNWRRSTRSWPIRASSRPAAMRCGAPASGPKRSRPSWRPPTRAGRSWSRSGPRRRVRRPRQRTP
jgi:hypothetical protein